MKKLKYQNDGFSLLEVLISIFILSIVVSSASVAFVISTKRTRNNEIRMTAMNLVNERMEYIRSLDFAKVGTKYKVSAGNYVDGDPAGDIIQEELVTSNGMNFKVLTTINWEEQGEWDLSGDAEWDYKSVKVTVIPQGIEDADKLTQSLETLVTRDFSQPLLAGYNIRTRFVRGWIYDLTEKIPVPNVKVKLIQGPSAVRYVNTSTKGIASFINISPGKYKVEFDPSSIGMILEPSVANPQNFSFGTDKTISKEYKVEYPCTIRMTLKKLNGGSINMNSGESGKVTLQSPFGLQEKVFQASDLNVNGKLSDQVLSGLWPLGDGYAGAYDIRDIRIPKYQYIESYTKDEDTVWDGKFDGPGTTKNIISYFIDFPVIPGNTSTNWVSNKKIIQGTFTTNGDAVFRTGNNRDTITMPSGRSSNFNAMRIFFENIGGATTSGLSVESSSNLALNAQEVVFQGKINFQVKNGNKGKITLSTKWKDGTQVGYIDGDSIGGESGVFYGKLFLREPLYVGNDLAIEAGGYYFPEGTELPTDTSKLIPFSKDNYIG